MNDATIKMLVAEAVRLDREIEGAKTRLKEIKAELINAACKREDAERVATEGGGWSWTAQGATPSSHPHTSHSGADHHGY